MLLLVQVLQLNKLVCLILIFTYSYKMCIGVMAKKNLKNHK